jgi:hypothetical protein
MKAILFIFRVLQLIIVFTFGYLMIPIMLGVIGTDYQIYYSLVSNPIYSIVGITMGLTILVAFVLSLPSKKDKQAKQN